jgi:hypothetical protein
MTENKQNQDCVKRASENQDYAPGMNAEATCDNQAEAAQNQAGSSGQFGSEFPSVDNQTNRKLK